MFMYSTRAAIQQLLKAQFAKITHSGDQESAALNMAKFIRSQTLLLLERLVQMDLDEAAGCCEHLHDQAEALYAMLNAQIGEKDA